MLVINMQGALSVMRFAAGIAVLVASLGAVNLWSSGTFGGWAYAGTVFGVVLAAFGVAWIVRSRLRNRQRRQLMAMRDSALW